MKSTPEQRAASLVESRKTLMLATGRDWPHASYAPFVRYGKSYFIYTSALSDHTHDLVANPKASVMFIDDEVHSKNPFARRRYTCPCTVTRIQRGSTVWDQVMECFAKKFGDVFDQIMPLGDFTLFELTPQSGGYVEGFGRAYQIGSEFDWSQHIKNDHKGDTP